jgi:O-succinylbenzoate synthase
MILKEASLTHVVIPLERPFETSFGVIDRRPALVVRLVSADGLEGYGESSPLYVPISEPETVDDAIPTIDSILRSLIGREIDGVGGVRPFLDAMPGHPVSKLGVETAYLHILSRERGIPLRELLGKPDKTSIPVGESVGIKKTVDEVLEEVGLFLARGFKRIKVKIKPGKDIEVMRAVREAFPAIALGADANSAYGKQDIGRLKELDDLGLMFLEQPFAADDFDAFVEYKRVCRTQICLDETVKDLASCRKTHELGFCDMMNVKPARLGSFSESVAVHDFCFERGIPLFGGGRLETGLGRYLNAELYSLPGFTLPADMTPPLEYFPEDIVRPSFTVTDGEHGLSDRPGIGADLDPEAVARHAKEERTYRPDGH